MHDIEAELVKALKFKKKIEDRQEYLTQILKAMDDRKRFTDKDYDNLSEEAADWHQAAVAAKDADDEVPDFGAEVDHEAEEAADQTEDEDDEELETEEEDDGGVNEDDENEDKQAGDDEGAEEEGSDTNGDGHTEDSSGVESDEPKELEAAPEDDEPEDTEEQILKKAKKFAKQAPNQAAKKPVAAPAKKVAPTPAKVNAKPAQKGTFPEPDYASLNNSRNRFGTVKGTKTDEAIKMYVKGATGKQIYDRLGGRYYNILQKLIKEGHRVEKDGAVFTLIHKDDVKARKAK